MNDQDEIYEAGTETPANLAPATNLPGGIDGTEAAPTPAPVAPLKPLVKRCAKTPSTIVLETIRADGRKFSGEWEAEDTGHRAQAYLYDGQACVCRIEFFNTYQSRAVGFKITKGAFLGLVSRKCHMIRQRHNAKVRKAAGKENG